MGTGCNVFVDFVEFLTRKLMFEYASQNLSQIDPKEIDFWNQDLSMAFINEVRFSFYLSFRDFAEFEKIFGENMRMICAIKKA
jgi:hypothetical protein